MAVRSPEAAAGSARRVAALFSRVTPWPSWDLASRSLWEKLASHAETLAANGDVEDELRGTILAKLAVASHYAGDYATGVERARRALEAIERVLGREHPDTLTSVYNLAALLKSKGDYDAAEPLVPPRAGDPRARAGSRACRYAHLRQQSGATARGAKVTTDAAEPLLPPRAGGQRADARAASNPNAHSVNNLASLLDEKGDYDAAEPLYRRALEARERVLGREHPETLTSVNNLAELLHSKGDYDAAEPLFRRALEAGERMLGREHPATLSSVNNLAALLRSKGDYDAAEPLYRRALGGPGARAGPRASRYAHLGEQSGVTAP